MRSASRVMIDFLEKAIGAGAFANCRLLGETIGVLSTLVSTAGLFHWPKCGESIKA